MDQVLSDARHSSGSRIVWLWLWDQAGRREGRLQPTIAMMSRATGIAKRSLDSRKLTSKSIPEGAYRRLVWMGLVEEVDRDDSGAIILYVRGVSYREPHRIAGDPQTDLDFERGSDTESQDQLRATPSQGGHPGQVNATAKLFGPADFSTGPPRGFCAETARSPITHDESSLKLDHNHDPRTTKKHGALGSSADRAVSARKPRDARCPAKGQPAVTAAEVLADEFALTLAATPDPARLHQCMQRVVDLVQREVGSEGTDPSQPWIVAEAVIEGGVPMSTLVKTLQYAKRQHAAGTARRGLAGCFYGTFQRRAERDAGFRWPKKPKAR